MSAKLALLVAVGCIVVGCQVDLAKLRRPAGEDGGMPGDAARETGAGDRYDSRLALDAQAADRVDGMRPVDSRDAVEVTLRSSADVCPDGERGAGSGLDGEGVQVDTSDPIDVAEGGTDASLPSSIDAAIVTFDSTVSGDTGPAAADAPSDTRESSDLPTGPGDVADAPIDVVRGDDVGSDLPAGTLPCPMTINGSLDGSDPMQTGRHSRVGPTSTCGMTKTAPNTGSDPVNPHLYDLYRFSNPSASAACFNFTLTYPGAQLYAVAYKQFNPSDITTGYLGDVGATVDSPQRMGISVAAGTTIEVVVYAIAIGSTSAGSYTLSCSTQ
jgi:hypothetical protein